MSMSRSSVEGSALAQWGELLAHAPRDTATPPPDMSITNTVKLVIWDLDDTFWKGTLSEEPVTAIHENIELVKVLAARGIISSICSKNDTDLAAKELHKMAMWDYFVLPSICFQAKGHAIASLIEALHLRPENVVFIDDNLSELAEAAFSCPGIMCLDSAGKLSAQMDSIHLRGSEDGNQPRLAQYQVIAARHVSKQSSGASAESFLRQSDIRVEIDYSVEAHIDRVIELINRSNQLNYTKVRVDSEERRAALLASLSAFGYRAGIVRAWDKYGDYGIVGFFMTLATLREYRLEHFVFSCRIMNMGIEQYVYNYLKRPDITIIASVANPIDCFPELDWIKPGSSDDIVDELRQFRAVLIGGCDMLQVSNYFTNNSVEFTNRDDRGFIKRLDDPFLILDDPERVRESPLRQHVPAFNADEMSELRLAVRGADVIVLSLYRMMEINYFRGSDGLMVRFDEDAVVDILRSDQALWFVRNFTFVEYSHEERINLIHRCLERLSSMVQDGAKIIVLFENTRKLENNPNEHFLRGLYNDFIRLECDRSPYLSYVDVNAVTSVEWLFDDGFHMSRRGYYELAQAIKKVIDKS